MARLTDKQIEAEKATAFVLLLQAAHKAVAQMRLTSGPGDFRHASELEAALGRVEASFSKKPKR